MTKPHDCIDLAHLPAWAGRVNDIIGHGMTSIVFAHGTDSVDMFTRDRFKVEYICKYMGFRVIDRFAVPHPVADIAAMDVYHLVGPRLTALTENDQIDGLVDAHEEFYRRAIYPCPDDVAYDYYHASFLRPGHPMHDAVEFKYTHPQCADIALDVHEHNFMRRADGVIIGNDLIMHSALYTMLLDYTNQRNAV